MSHRVNKHHLRGEANPKAKLTEAQVLEILSSPLKSPALAKRYGVHESCIRKIRGLKRWNWL